MTLILVSLFTAFFLATVEGLVAVLSDFIGATTPNAVFSLIFSAVGNLITYSTVKNYVLYTVACAFLGRVFLTTAERVSTYRPTIINSARE